MIPGSNGQDHGDKLVTALEVGDAILRICDLAFVLVINAIISLPGPRRR
jgi:hypothetical protein